MEWSGEFLLSASLSSSHLRVVRMHASHLFIMEEDNMLEAHPETRVAIPKYLHMLFVCNTVLSVLATVYFNEIVIDALLPKGCMPTLFCSFIMGAVIPLLGVVFFNLVHMLGFIGIYQIVKPRYRRQRRPSL